MKTIKSSKSKKAKTNDTTDAIDKSNLSKNQNKKSFFKKIAIIISALIILVLIIAAALFMEKHVMLSRAKIALPEPIYKSSVSIEEAIQARRSVREFKNEPISMQQLAQLLWAAQGITSKNGFRSAPSAGALYPLEIYVVSGNVSGLAPGVYHYLPKEHSLELLVAGDKRGDLEKAAFMTADVKQGQIDIVITGVFKRTTAKYGNRGLRYVYMEAGHAAQNIYLQAVSLKLGTVSMGAFKDADVSKVLQIVGQEDPLYIMPVGKI